MKDKDFVKEAVKKLNQIKLKDKHLRVDLEEGGKNDYDTTLFIGNLPFVINEEDLRAHIDAEGILNIRVIRDSKTFIGKGIAYV